MTTENTKNNSSSPYRGRCTELSVINEVPIDISMLVEEYQGVMAGDPTRRVFPVRSQLTWFRLKNEAGTVTTEIVKEDEYLVVVKATVIVNGVTVASAHGSADATRDGVDGFKLIESAESRAVSRALDFAGYGCQLDLKTFDEPDPTPATGGPQADTDTTGTKTPDEPVTHQPGALMGKKKVDANAPCTIIDIKDLEGAAETSTLAKKPKARKKNAGEDAEQEPESSKTAASDEEAGGTESIIPVADEGNTEMRESSVDEEPTPSVQTQESTNNTPTEPVEVTGDSNMDGTAIKAPAQLMREQIDAVLAGSLPRPAFDTEIFGDGEIDPSGMFFNPDAEKETKMNNLELQIALSFLVANPDVAGCLPYPATKGSLVGKTFGEIYAENAAIGLQAASYCKKLYTGEDVCSYAAALILAKEGE